MFTWTAIIGTIFSIFSSFACIKYFILSDFRVNASRFKSIYNKLPNITHFIFLDEVVDDKTYPTIWQGIIFHPKAWFYINLSEQMMNAGDQGKMSTINITTLRWNKLKVKEILYEDDKNDERVPVELLYTYGKDLIGYVNPNIPQPLHEPKYWTDIVADVEKVHIGKLNKLGILLHGAPGNGKTTFIKYLSSKYKFPIQLINLSAELSNNQLMVMFSQIRPHTIILLEDFDNIFWHRDLILKHNEAKLSFDGILQCFDGVFNDYQQNIFIITANNISAIDPALKERPSRFKYVREFANPRLNLLPPDWNVDNFNLDQILRLKEFKDTGFSKEECYWKLNLLLNNDIIDIVKPNLIDCYTDLVSLTPSVLKTDSKDNNFWKTLLPK